jgi:hypothetical protein
MSVSGLMQSIRKIWSHSSPHNGCYNVIGLSQASRGEVDKRTPYGAYIEKQYRHLCCTTFLERFGSAHDHILNVMTLQSCFAVESVHLIF